ncbi:hypothetical protein CEUSTIGMA_g11440.t1 [Chlamydomonas eustigma]|uniref:EF-hand domain-containing protein n=1 Tax=Chlamydomonas eustigma TaxID=1157962 RepID=A0A250XLN5_9CHLO|nr:hypothetical protein CEUSTIGMA_g11440.t1 [Chlamydomonas eustigma]|eukprot:GAX84015.1 hypothetical protein CEUSTIGMA_g11440.t1 [Chlamydomonas eustigma]
MLKMPPKDKHKLEPALLHLLCESPRPGASSVPSSLCGVSIAYLEQLCSSIEDNGTTSMSTASFAQRVLNPLLNKLSQKTRLWDVVPAQHIGHPQWYVVHTWTGSFHDLVKSLKLELATPSSPKPNNSDISNQKPEQMVMVWMDIFALPLSGPALDPEAAAQVVNDAQEACTQGVVLVVDRAMAVLSRAWCMYEVFASIYKRDSNVYMTFVDDFDLAEISKLKDLCVNMDVNKTETSRPADKTFALGEVRRTWGLQRSNRHLTEALYCGLFCRLRWSSRPANQILLAALQLQAGELVQAQTTLSSVDKLCTDDKALAEIRDLFKIFDADGSGELDRDEFIELLQTAGWSEEDAIEIFEEVDEDGGGSIGLDEFEHWWEESANKMESVQRRVVSMTMQALLASVEAVPHYLLNISLEFKELAEWYRGKHGDLVASLKGGSSEIVLPQPTIHGDMYAVLSTVSDKYRTGEYRQGAKLMHELLLLNVDQLDVPPHKLQPPRGYTETRDDAQLLAIYMANFAKLLKLQGPDAYEPVLDFLVHAAHDLWIHGADAGVGKPRKTETAAISLGMKGGAFQDANFKETQVMMSKWLSKCKGQVASRHIGDRAANSPGAAGSTAGASGSTGSTAARGSKASGLVPSSGQSLTAALSPFMMAAPIPSLADLRTRMYNGKSGVLGSGLEEENTSPIVVKKRAPKLERRRSLILEEMLNEQRAVLQRPPSLQHRDGKNPERDSRGSEAADGGTEQDRGGAAASLIGADKIQHKFLNMMMSHVGTNSPAAAENAAGAGLKAGEGVEQQASSQELAPSQQQQQQQQEPQSTLQAMSDHLARITGKVSDRVKMERNKINTVLSPMDIIQLTGKPSQVEPSSSSLSLLAPDPRMTSIRARLLASGHNNNAAAAAGGGASPGGPLLQPSDLSSSNLMNIMRKVPAGSAPYRSSAAGGPATGGGTLNGGRVQLMTLQDRECSGDISGETGTVRSNDRKNQRSSIPNLTTMNGSVLSTSAAQSSISAPVSKLPPGTKVSGSSVQASSGGSGSSAIRPRSLSVLPSTSELGHIPRSSPPRGSAAVERPSAVIGRSLEKPADATSALSSEVLTRNNRSMENLAHLAGGIAGKGSGMKVIQSSEAHGSASGDHSTVNTEVVHEEEAVGGVRRPARIKPIAASYDGTPASLASMGENKVSASSGFKLPSIFRKILS